MLTPYQFASNNPIANIDIDGLEGQYAGWQDYHRLNTTAIKGGDVKSVAAEIDRKNKINTVIAFGTVLAPLVGVTAVETMPVWLPWAYSSAASGILATGKYSPEALGFAAGAMGFDGEIPGTSGDEFGRLINKGFKLGGAYGRMKNFYGSLGELLTNKNHLPTLKSYELSGFKISSYMGSANIISIQDHKDFISTGGKEVAKMFRQAEANLLSEGRYLNANAIREQFGDIYNEGLDDARDHFVKEVIPILEEQSKKNKQ
ncbi:hypothetical protein DN752_05565 [Echinicola strongylocentroti]|uniref:Uncharacterized protein n=1 Tax=Echinicola strongylocentroti TaxID=1795355 RepID=A0A2Z4IG14_9BACT|nr:hypothetical protein [Echinicola strongylocentroti]AWW29630.1 hypothetical protein DN752_05565 [Echinicola strongylocentroti]